MVLTTDYFLFDIGLTAHSLLYFCIFHVLHQKTCLVVAQSHLDLGLQFLAKGQIGEALQQFHSAVEEDPNDFMPYYRRATAYLALGKGKAALQDLNKVIEFRPDFTAARNQRAGVLTKFGLFEDALGDYQFVRANSNAESLNIDDKIQNLLSLQSLEVEINELLSHDSDHRGAIPLLEKLIEDAPWKVEFREMRADSFAAIGEHAKAVFDLKQLTKLINDNTVGFLKLSKLYYELADDEQSLNEIRECLKLDPDHKECFSHYKKVKKLHKQITDAQDFLSNGETVQCVERLDAALKTEPNVASFKAKLTPKKCKCLSKSKQSQEALKICSEGISLDETDWGMLADRAEAYLIEEEYQKAIDDFQAAISLNEDSRSLKESLSRAKKLLKQSERRDYYKILGVKRNADKKEINKAYRKLAQEWHPDKYDGPNAEDAEKKFMDIAAAKEVLSDPEMREKFDNGEDPLDPEQQQGQGFNPFQGGGGFPFNFQGGNFQFKFKF